MSRLISIRRSIAVFLFYLVGYLMGVNHNAYMTAILISAAAVFIVAYDIALDDKRQKNNKKQVNRPKIQNEKVVEIEYDQKVYIANKSDLIFIREVKHDIRS